jgi:hypothetical protein
LQEALLPSDEINRREGGGIAGRLEVAGDLLGERLGDTDLGRRRRRILVRFLAPGGQQRHTNENRASGHVLTSPHFSNASSVSLDVTEA